MNENQETTSAEEPGRDKKELYKMIRRLGIVQVWIGLFVLCLCIGILESIDERYWLTWSRADFSVCVFIIITGCFGITSGIHQKNSILTGTFMALSILCAILSLAVVIKNGFSLRQATDNWSFNASSGMLLFISLFLTMIFEFFLSTISGAYCFNAANGCYRPIRQQGAAPPTTTQFPLFTTPGGQMMVIPGVAVAYNNMRETQQQMPPAYDDEKWTWM